MQSLAGCWPTEPSPCFSWWGWRRRIKAIIVTLSCNVKVISFQRNFTTRLIPKNGTHLLNTALKTRPAPSSQIHTKINTLTIIRTQGHNSLPSPVFCFCLIFFSPMLKVFVLCSRFLVWLHGLRCSGCQNQWWIKTIWPLQHLVYYQFGAFVSLSSRHSIYTAMHAKQDTFRDEPWYRVILALWGTLVVGHQGFCCALRSLHQPENNGIIFRTFWNTYKSYDQPSFQCSHRNQHDFIQLLRCSRNMVQFFLSEEQQRSLTKKKI